MNSWLIGAAGRLLPAEWRDWARAMKAEANEVPPGSRGRFIWGCVSAILRKAVERQICDWLAQPAMLLAVFVSGLVIALHDRASDSRTLMWLSLLSGSALGGWLRPVAAWRWGILLALGIPLLSLLDPGGGPYAIDRADAQYGILPAIAAACLAAFIRRRISAVVFLLAVIPGLVQAQRRELTATDLAAFADSMFAEYLRLSSAPSLAFVVVKGDSILFARGYGSEDPAGSRPVDPHATVFWMGSVSKLVTADAVMREIEKGRLSLDTTVRSLVDWTLPSHAGWRDVTVRDLLTHTSGLDEPFMAGTADTPEDLVPLAEYLREVRWRSGRPPGDILRYSNHGMALAGLLVERASGTPFEEYVEREIFGPLSMQHSTFRQPMNSDLSRRLATAGTDARVDFLLPTPAGAMVGTAADMGRFLIAQLDTADSRAASLRVMHQTQWRAHPGVPGIASGWFETVLGGVEGLYHTGARHHFSVAWIAPRHHVGVFLVHSMRQGGPFQYLRTAVIREFARRYLPPNSASGTSSAVVGIAGTYQPMLLSTTTVERLGYLLLDSRVQVDGEGSLTLSAPGGLGIVRAQPAGQNLFEVPDGPQTGLRIGFLGDASPPRLVLGGTLLDPVVMERLSWWQHGLFHAIALGGATLVLTLAGIAYAVRGLLRRRRDVPAEPNRVKPFVMTAAAGFILTLASLLAVIFTTPEMGAAAHMRAGLRVVLAFLTGACASAIAIPLVTLLRWRQHESRAMSSLLSLCAVLVAGLLWHYRLIGFRL